MAVDESTLSSGLRQALGVLREKRDAKARLEVVQDNWAYVWVNDLRKDEKLDEAARGGWIRLPTTFPASVPHGFVTKHQLPSTAKGYNHLHDIAKPVKDYGGDHYYSWKWEGAPDVETPEDILMVIKWYERRIRD